MRSNPYVHLVIYSVIMEIYCLLILWNDKNLDFIYIYDVKWRNHSLFYAHKFLQL